MRFILFLLLVTFTFSARAEWLGEGLEKNEPLVIEYVLSLKPGKNPIEGIMLTDGNLCLKSFRYRSQAEQDRLGTNIHLFQKDGGYPAIIWLDSEAKPLPLPACQPDSEEPWFPWYQGSLISGDVYTYPEVRPDHSIVTNYCPGASWRRVDDV